jgi:type IV secretory pathway protease TraF
MQKANRIRTVIAAGLGIATLAVASCMKPKVLVLYNYTDSMPHGVYLVEHREVYQRGDVVVFAVPLSVRALVNERHWLHENGFLMKPLIGLKGDSVSTKDGRFLVGIDGMSNSFDSRYFGPIPERSVIGVAVPVWLF